MRLSMQKPLPQARTGARSLVCGWRRPCVGCMRMLLLLLEHGMHTGSSTPCRADDTPSTPPGQRVRTRAHLVGFGPGRQPCGARRRRARRRAWRRAGSGRRYGRPVRGAGQLREADTAVLAVVLRGGGEGPWWTCTRQHPSRVAAWGAGRARGVGGSPIYMRSLASCEVGRFQQADPKAGREWDARKAGEDGEAEEGARLVPVSYRGFGHTPTSPPTTQPPRSDIVNSTISHQARPLGFGVLPAAPLL